MITYYPLPTKIRRVERATDTLPAGVAEALFTVTGGRIVVYQIVGEVTTVIQTQANATKLIHTVGTGTDTDLCAVLDITGDEVGTLYGITGTFADAMLGAGQALPGQTSPIVLKPGDIELSCAATNTGSVKWSLYWAPLDDGVSVAAA
jgi:hypothetical protein